MGPGISYLFHQTTLTAIPQVGLSYPCSAPEAISAICISNSWNLNSVYRQGEIDRLIISSLFYGLTYSRSLDTTHLTGLRGKLEWGGVGWWGACHTATQVQEVEEWGRISGSTGSRHANPTRPFQLLLIPALLLSPTHSPTAHRLSPHY